MAISVIGLALIVFLVMAGVGLFAILGAGKGEGGGGTAIMVTVGALALLVVVGIAGALFFVGARSVSSGPMPMPLATFTTTPAIAAGSVHISMTYSDVPNSEVSALTDLFDSLERKHLASINGSSGSGSSVSSGPFNSSGESDITLSPEQGTDAATLAAALSTFAAEFHAEIAAKQLNKHTVKLDIVNGFTPAGVGIVTEPAKPIEVAPSPAVAE